MSEETTELGFTVEAVSRLESSLRGQYDVTRIAEKAPELVQLVTWLLSLPGMKMDVIAKHAGIAWETVAAIARTREESIREFRGRLSRELQLVIEAATPGLLAKAAEGKLSALDFKLLVDAWQQLSGEGHLVRVEEGRAAVDPDRAALDALLAGRGMVSGGGKVLAKGGGGPVVEIEAESVDQEGGRA